MSTSECIGCGFCCRRAPCPLSSYAGLWSEEGCSALSWSEDEHRWVCELVSKAEGARRQEVESILSIGAGCCSNLNTYRLVNHVPTPEEMKDEGALLKTLSEEHRGLLDITFGLLVFGRQRDEV